MGGRGSGGSRGGGGASKSIDAKTENKLNSLLNKSYKYDDEAYEFSRRAATERAMAKRYISSILFVSDSFSILLINLTSCLNWFVLVVR